MTHGKDDAPPAAQRVRPQPLIAVRDVAASGRWYQTLLECKSGHGGDLYEMLISDGELVVQLHAWDREQHANLMDASSSKPGHGVLLWFQVADLDRAALAARGLAAEVVEEVHTNSNSGQRELWLRDPDGYVVVLSGR